jgi:hypothetical protein
MKRKARGHPPVARFLPYRSLNHRCNSRMQQSRQAGAPPDGFAGAGPDVWGETVRRGYRRQSAWLRNGNPFVKLNARAEG